MQDPERGNKWPLDKGKDGGYDWTELTKGGRNGFFMLLLTLVWWWKALRTPGERQDFESVLVEVEWALKGIVSSLDLKSKVAKRLGEDNPEEEEARPAKR